jgi:CRP-like cAMP-binding protein
VEFRNYLLSALGDADRQAIIPVLAEFPLERGQVLFEPGDPVLHVYFPSSAILSVATVMRDGATVETSTIGNESGAPLLRAMIAQPSPSRIFAQVGGAALRLSASALRTRATQSPAMMSLLVRHASSITFQAEQGVACNVLHGAVARLARWLLMTQDRTGSRSLPLTQEYMSVMTGVQRTTISVVANELRRGGLIRFSRGVVEITDRKGLEAAACECYRSVREEFDAMRSFSGGA